MKKRSSFILLALAYFLLINLLVAPTLFAQEDSRRVGNGICSAGDWIEFETRTTTMANFDDAPDDCDYSRWLAWRSENPYEDPHDLAVADAWESEQTAEISEFGEEEGEGYEKDKGELRPVDERLAEEMNTFERETRELYSMTAEELKDAYNLENLLANLQKDEILVHAEEFDKPGEAAYVPATADDVLAWEAEQNAADSWAFNPERALNVFGPNPSAIENLVGLWARAREFFNEGYTARRTGETIAEENLGFIKKSGLEYQSYQNILDYVNGIRDSDMSATERIRGTYNAVLQEIRHDQTKHNYGMRQALEMGFGVCRHQAAALADALNRAGSGIQANVVFNDHHAWVRASAEGRTFDLDPNLYRTYAALPTRKVSQNQIIKLTGFSLFPIDYIFAEIASLEAENAASNTKTLFCSNLSLCFNVSVPTIVHSDDETGFEMWQEYGKYSKEWAIVDFIKNPYLELNFSGFDTIKINLLGTGREAIIFDKLVKSKKLFFLYSGFKADDGEQIIVQIISGKPITENKELMAMLAGEEFAEKPLLEYKWIMVIFIIVLIAIATIVILIIIAGYKNKITALGISPEALAEEKKRVKGRIAAIIIILLLIFAVLFFPIKQTAVKEQTVVLVFDASSSMADWSYVNGSTSKTISKINIEKQALIEIVKSFDSNTKYVLEAFSRMPRFYYLNENKTGTYSTYPLEFEEVAINSSFFFTKQDSLLAIEAINKTDIFPYTYIEEALIAGLKIAKNSTSPIKKIVLLTDGGAEVDLQKILDELEPPISISTIGIGWFGKKDYNQELLQNISEIGGGSFYEADNYNKLSEALSSATKPGKTSIFKEILSAVINEK